MKVHRVAILLALLVVASGVGVGAATPSHTDAEPPTMGAHLSAFMAASAAQTGGSVENGMWGAAYANASNPSEKRALVEARLGSLNVTVAELQEQRRAIREAYRNGSIDRTTYQARMATLVGQLAALGPGIEEAGERGNEVGVNVTRLEELRSSASELGGGAVSQLARNLTGGQGPPGPAGVFGGPGPAGDRGQGAGNATNGTDGPGGGQGPPEGQGPPDDGGQGPPSGNDTSAKGADNDDG